MKQILINNIEFAEKNLEISGYINPSDCKRLTGSLTLSNEKLTNICYTLTGAAKNLHLPSLHLTIDATLSVFCQRCLEKMEVNLVLAFDYVVANTEPTEADESDEIDWLEASTTMNLTELIEDELLIAMPIAPAHETNCIKASLESGEKANPFAVLKGKFK